MGAEARSARELATRCSFNPELAATQRGRVALLRLFRRESRYALASAFGGLATWQGGGDRLVCRDGGSAREPL